MYLVDTSVWVDFLRGRETPEVGALSNLLGEDQPVGTAPPILQEILQGAESEERQRSWIRRFGALPCYAPADARECAIGAARLFLACRSAGRTPRSSNDCLIARIAIEHELVLLHSDRDFEAIAHVEPKLKVYA
jgi:hypothetical protein